MFLSNWTVTGILYLWHSRKRQITIKKQKMTSYCFNNVLIKKEKSYKGYKILYTFVYSNHDHHAHEGIEYEILLWK